VSLETAGIILANLFAAAPDLPLGDVKIDGAIFPQF